MRFSIPNEPNAARLTDSLRYLGYGNYEAIADLVDNSIDADASHIHIRIQQRDGQYRVIIADDGTGMDHHTLDEAMRLGSDTRRNEASDLGRFGMGLVTASLSMARRCHVITVGPDGCLSSAWDVDEIRGQQAFVKHLDHAATDEEELFKELTGGAESGTAVILSKCDNIGNKNTTNFASNLKSYIGRVHRYFIKDPGDEALGGRVITINGDRISAIDPLELRDERTEVVVDENFPISAAVDGSKNVESVRVRIVLIPDTPSNELDIARSMKAQGFYVMRNQREIVNAVTLNFFTKHNDFNRMRGELFFPGGLDRLVGIEFTKRQVDLDQSVYDQLASSLVPTCRSIKRREAGRKRIASTEAEKHLHEQAARAIAEKDKLLIKPKARIEKRASHNGDSPGQPASGPKTGSARTNLRRTQAVAAALNCEITEERMGPNGQIYECDLEGRRIIIRYNVEHPFYQRFVLDYLDDSRVVTAADFLIYSLAAAELKAGIDEGELEAISNFKAYLSANLRTLLH